MRVLVVEDFPAMRLGLVQALTGDGYAVDAAGDGEEGLRLASTTAYDAVVLDLMLPRMDGVEVVRSLRRQGGESGAVHILMLTARDAVNDRVRALDAGADDYLVKPFALAELLARVRALVRRTYQRKDPLLIIGNLEIDTATRTARRAGALLDLTPKEYALLELLAVRSGSVVSRTDIWEHCYSLDSEAISNVVDVCISTLRRKLEQSDPTRLLHTRRGEGYLLAVTEHS